MVLLSIVILSLSNTNIRYRVAATQCTPLELYLLVALPAPKLWIRTSSDSLLMSNGLITVMLAHRVDHAPSPLMIALLAISTAHIF